MPRSPEIKSEKEEGELSEDDFEDDRRHNKFKRHSSVRSRSRDRQGKSVREREAQLSQNHRMPQTQTRVAKIEKSQQVIDQDSIDSPIDEEEMLKREQEARQLLIQRLKQVVPMLPVEQENQNESLQQLPKVDPPPSVVNNLIPEQRSEKVYNLFESSDDENDDALTKVINSVEPDGYLDDGYYVPKIGSKIGDFTVTDISGRGVFATVVRATRNNITYAIKIIRIKLDVMRQAGEKERDTVTLLNHVDPGDRKHIIRLYETFEFQRHLCLVYEIMDINLRETLQKFGKGIGLSLAAVAMYARQIFTALSLLHRMNLIHSDLKPDNLMVSQEHKKLKLCDFGSVVGYSELEQMKTDHLVSPYYRPPEVILGLMPLDGAVDIWSAGATLFEMYTGKFMFPAHTNNQLLYLMMRCKGKFPSKLTKKGLYSQMHFCSSSGQFQMMQANGEVKLTNITEAETIFDRIKEVPDTKAGDNLQIFADFLERCTCLDPQKRITATEALEHRFLSLI